MKETVKRVKPRSGFKLNFMNMFGLGWLPIINSLLTSNYMFNLMVFLDFMYNVLPRDKDNSNKCYPIMLQDLFENFRTCSFSATQVVIIGKEPFTSTNATGIPFANPVNVSGPVEGASILIDRCIRNTYNTDKLTVKYRDETMYSWAGQGVLLLDAASTSMGKINNAHSKYWKQFTRSIITTLSNKKDNIIFVFWGKEASYFQRYVDGTKHDKLFYCHPSDMVKQNKDWNCPNFKQIDEIIKKKYGEEEYDKKRIYW